MISMIVIVGVIGLRYANGMHPRVPVSYALGAAVDALVLLGWFVLPSADRTRRTAEKYAHQLLQGAVTLSETATGGSGIK